MSKLTSFINKRNSATDRGCFYVFAYALEGEISYIGMSSDPAALFAKEKEECLSESILHQFFREFKDQIELKILFKSKVRDHAYDYRNLLIYQLKKKGEPLLNMANLISDRKAASIITNMKTWQPIVEEQKYKNWNDKKVPKSWVEIDGWVMPDEVSGFFPGNRLLYGTPLFYLHDGLWWDLINHTYTEN